MKILDRLYEFGHEKNLAFILIGGHAMNALGDRRQTKDVDIVVALDAADEWKRFLLSIGYELFHESSAFLQFNAPDLTEWPIDIMLVDKDTFESLKQNTTEVNLGGKCDVFIPATQHLIAMKLHALNQRKTAKRLSDLSDIITLIVNEKIDVHSQEFKALCVQYGSEELYETILQQLR